ncbi:unnamed protein product [Peronospora belbahrii]|uniref:Large ribosomal subunit protein mL54 n=1 Tax=Peronospora belbahrii TaxID=622444 RepID=A0AAU9L2G4_9STRA|nr:unnamed protein product [Peronospora belbahrii]CAH0521403.1 unnamed protein product [Peronospora belbahrii]
MLMPMRRLIGRYCATPLSVNARSFAAKGKGNAAVVEEVVDLTKVVPTNIFKDGTHPELKEKSEYPEWLFTLLEPKLTLSELERIGFDNLELEDQHHYLVLVNRGLIKASNAEKAKK